MAWATNEYFKCPKCGFVTQRMVGDCRPSMVELKPCPVCGSHMKIVSKDELSSFETVASNLGKIVDRFKK